MAAYNKEGKNVYESKRLDYLALVAGIFEGLGLLNEVVDQALEEDAAFKLSSGMCLRAVIFSALSFSMRSL